MSATVPKKWMKKAGQHTEGQESDKQKRNTLTFSDKIKIIDHMQAHQLSQKQAAEYWQENGYWDGVSQKNISTWVKNEQRI